MAIKKLKYPLHNEDEYKARVVFSLFSEKDTSSVIGETLKEQIKRFPDEVNALVRDTAQKVADGTITAKEAEELLAQSREKKEALERAAREFKGEANKPVVKDKIPKFETAVSLYLPPGLVFRDNVTYENFDLGVSGAAAASGMGIAQSLSSGVSSFIESVKASFQGDATNLAKLGAVQTAAKFGTFTDEIGAGLKIAGGVTVNPNTRAIFKSVNIRDFAFTFKMIARSPEEAKMIKEIVRFFRTEVYPENIGGKAGNVDISLGYVFPKKFNIEIQYNGNRNAPEIKPCYLRDVNTTYNASGMGMHQDGEFLEVDLTLMFQETRALTKEDIIADKYYSQDPA